MTSKGNFLAAVLFASLLTGANLVVDAKDSDTSQAGQESDASQADDPSPLQADRKRAPSSERDVKTSVVSRARTLVRLRTTRYCSQYEHCSSHEGLDPASHCDLLLVDLRKRSLSVENPMERYRLKHAIEELSFARQVYSDALANKLTSEKEEELAQVLQIDERRNWAKGTLEELRTGRMTAERGGKTKRGLFGEPRENYKYDVLRPNEPETRYDSESVHPLHDPGTRNRIEHQNEHGKDANVDG